MKTLLTCLGESLIDFLPIEQSGRTAGFMMRPGGSPLNTAVGLARLKQPTAFAGKVSTDFFGRFLRDYMAAESLDERMLVETPAPTTLAFVAVENGEPAFSFYGDGTADSLLEPEELPEALFAETKILHTGSICLLRGTTCEAVLAAFQRLKGRALLSFDPNIRPVLVRDEPGYRALLARLFSLSDIVKISAVDLEWLAPGRPVEQVAADIRAQGPAIVAVTRGVHGAILIREDGQWTVPAMPVEVADTVGAGDAFTSGLLAWLNGHDKTSRPALMEMTPAEIQAALRFAAAVAGLTCARPGADPPRRAELPRALQE